LKRLAQLISCGSRSAYKEVPQIKLTEILTLCVNQRILEGRLNRNPITGLADGKIFDIKKAVSLRALFGKKNSKWQAVSARIKSSIPEL
jgi:hypothetical protein